LIQRDRLTPLLLTLCDRYGDKIATATASSGEAAVKSAILLLARSQALRGWHAELFRAFLDGLALVDRLDGADPLELGAKLCRWSIRRAAAKVDLASLGSPCRPIDACVGNLGNPPGCD